MPTYTPNIPQPTDIPSQSQDLILQNFQTINTGFAKDHVSLTFGGLSTQIGKHDHMTMPVQTSPADPPTDISETVLYTKNDTNSNPQLYFRQQNNGPIIQMSGSNVSIGASGYTFLPGRLLLQWGSSNFNNAGGIIVTFPIAFSAAPYSVVVTKNDSVNTAILPTFLVRGLAANQFQLNGSTGANPSTVAWMAIGPQ